VTFVAVITARTDRFVEQGAGNFIFTFLSSIGAVHCQKVLALNKRVQVDYISHNWAVSFVVPIAVVGVRTGRYTLVADVSSILLPLSAISYQLPANYAAASSSPSSTDATRTCVASPSISSARMCM